MGNVIPADDQRAPYNAEIEQGVDNADACKESSARIGDVHGQCIGEPEVMTELDRGGWFERKSEGLLIVPADVARKEDVDVLRFSMGSTQAILNRAFREIYRELSFSSNA